MFNPEDCTFLLNISISNCRKTYWHMAKNGHVQRAIPKERLARAGYYSILDRYESLY